MARRTKTLPVLALVLLAVAPALSQKTLTASEAKDHIGEQATVCGKVVSTGDAENSRGKPTFLNLDKPYPEQIFTVVIWDSDRSKFGDPERHIGASMSASPGRSRPLRVCPRLWLTNCHS